MILLTLSILSSFAIDCPEPVQPEKIDGLLDQAERQFVDFDDEGFATSVNEATGIYLPCVSSKLEAKTIGKLHRMMALHQLSNGDEERAKASMVASKRVDPNYTFSDELLPSDHILRQAFETTPVEQPTKRVPEPKAGSLFFDGQQTRERPKLTPTVAQVFSETGATQATMYLGFRESLPDYQAVPRRRNMLLGCTIGAAALSAGTYGAAFGRKQRMYRDSLEPSQRAEHLEGLQGAGNNLTMLSGGLAIIAGGCGVSAGLIGQQ